jgi:hypothetical protein
MELSEVVENLCSHDPRNPDWANLYAYDDPEDIREPRKDCFCDNCFYRRDRLALEILRLRSISNI